MKLFKKDDKVLCITDAYSTIKLGELVTIQKFIDKDFFLIDEFVGAYDIDDFVKPILVRSEIESDEIYYGTQE